MKTRYAATLIILSLGARSSWAAPKLIALAGDSTVATYKSGDKQGWGASLSSYVVSSKAKVSNFAAGGKSTKTFVKEGYWQKLLNAKPNIVFIQFGHNDQSKDESNPSSTYPENLKKMVRDITNKNGIAVLVTPPFRCRFNGSTPNDTLKDYNKAMRSLAAKEGIPLIDLAAMTSAELKKRGPSKACKELYVKGDTTHMNKTGSKLFAGFVAQGAQKIPSIAGYFLK